METPGAKLRASGNFDMDDSDSDDSNWEQTEEEREAEELEVRVRCLHHLRLACVLKLSTLAPSTRYIPIGLSSVISSCKFNPDNLSVLR